MLNIVVLFSVEFYTLQRHNSDVMINRRRENVQRIRKLFQRALFAVTVSAERREKLKRALMKKGIIKNNKYFGTTIYDIYEVSLTYIFICICLPKLNIQGVQKILYFNQFEQYEDIFRDTLYFRQIKPRFPSL